MINLMNISELIEEWNDKLNSLAGKYMDSPWMGAVVVFVLFALGCWAISALTKK